MALTTKQVEPLEAAIPAGVLSVRYAHRTVTYQRLAEMRRPLQQMPDELGQAPGVPPRPPAMRPSQPRTGTLCSRPEHLPPPPP